MPQLQFRFPSICLDSPPLSRLAQSNQLSADAWCNPFIELTTVEVAFTSYLDDVHMYIIKITLLSGLRKILAVFEQWMFLQRRLISLVNLLVNIYRLHHIQLHHRYQACIHLTVIGNMYTSRMPMHYVLYAGNIVPSGTDHWISYKWTKHQKISVFDAFPPIRYETSVSLVFRNGVTRWDMYLVLC